MQRNAWDLPEPAGVKPVREPPIWTWLIVMLLALIVAFLAFAIPIPIYFRFLPGPVERVEGLIEIDRAKTYSSEGRLLLTTVTIDNQVTFVELVQAGFSDSIAVVEAESVTHGQSFDELERDAKREIRLSKRQAIQVALGELGIGRARGEGVRVTSIVDETPAADVFEEGDVVRSIEGRPVETTCDVLRHINQAGVGERLRFTVERDGRTRRLTVSTVNHPADPGAPFVGIGMDEINFDFASKVDVEIRSGEIGGPSAGLMFALGVYDRLTPDDLTGGRSVAGTGTIECTGKIGSIGGIEQKIAAAEREGVDVFLAPSGNFDAAERVADDLEVVAVSDFGDALDYLEALK